METNSITLPCEPVYVKLGTTCSNDVQKSIFDSEDDEDEDDNYKTVVIKLMNREVYEQSKRKHFDDLVDTFNEGLDMYLDCGSWAADDEFDLIETIFKEYDGMYIVHNSDDSK